MRVSAETLRRLSCDASMVTGGATSLDNLMLLCRRHHTWFMKARSRRLLSAGSANALRRGDDARFNLGYVVDVLRTRPAAS